MIFTYIDIALVLRLVKFVSAVSTDHWLTKQQFRREQESPDCLCFYIIGVCDADPGVKFFKIKKKKERKNKLFQMKQNEAKIYNNNFIYLSCIPASV